MAQQVEIVKESEEFKETWTQKIVHSLIKFTFSQLVKLLWIESVEGLEHIPKSGAAIIAANHASYLDFICFIAVSPRKIHYLAAEKFWSNPMWRFLMWGTAQIRVDRLLAEKGTLHKKVASAIIQERVIGIFPEGTRTRSGEMGPAFTGVARYALAHKVPVIPVGIQRTFEVMAPHHKRPRLKRIVRVKVGPPVDLTEYHKIPNHEKHHYEQATDDIMQRIATLAGKEFRHFFHKKK